jgi:hypothetical protein
LSNGGSAASACHEATEKFGIQVLPDTVRKLIKTDNITVTKSGPKGDLSDEQFRAISDALMSYVAIAQSNGDFEKKNSFLESLLQKCCRSFWTTYSNLNDWFNAWEQFVLEKGFASKNAEGSVEFSKEQCKRIINMDETKFSVDGSDGGVGGRPSLSFTVKGLCRPGTATNKSSMTCTLMCGSNADNEPLPLHIMFASKATDEQNFTVSADWVTNLPRVKVQFGHEEEKEFCASLTVNSKGGTDSRVLRQVICFYVERLYPDASDRAGKRVLVKIDGGPGQLDIQLIAHLRARGIYLFNSVQNTTHVSQETDQNYGLFKSILRKYTQQLINEEISKFNEQQRLHDMDPSTYQKPKKLPQLDPSHYGIILSGRAADAENHLCALKSPFYEGFSEEKIRKHGENVEGFH